MGVGRFAISSDEEELRSTALSGVIGAVVWALVAALLNILMAPFQRQVADQILRSARDMPPEARAILESVGGSSTFTFVVGFVMFLFVGSIFATLGGVLGAAFFRNDVPPALGGPVQPPPLPPM